MPKKPTEPFGTIVFPKHGRVRKNFFKLSEHKELQESGAIARFIELYNKHISPDITNLQSLPEDDHDSKAEFRGETIEIQLTELKSREFLTPATNSDGSPNSATQFPLVFTGNGQFWMDEEACRQALWKVINKKLNKNYAASRIPVWLIVYSTFPYSTEYSSGGERKVSDALKLARENLNGRDISPISMIWFTDLITRPVQVYTTK